MAILLGMVVGLLLGLTGAGGSVLAVPLLTWGAGLSLPEAKPIALIGVSVAAGLGTLLAWDTSYVRYRAAILMAAASLLGAPAGLWLAHRMAHQTLVLLFSAVMALAALRMWRQGRATAAHSPADGAICRLDPGTGRLVWTWSAGLTVAGVGAAAGFFAGLLGVGGGFVIVPSLRAVSELSMQSTIGTSLMAVALISAVTAGVAVTGAPALEWSAAIGFALGALVGVAVARGFAPRIAGPGLQRGFAVLMIALALALALQAAWSSRPT